MTVDTDQFQTLSAAVLRMADCLGELSASVGQLVDQGRHDQQAARTVPRVGRPVVARVPLPRRQVAVVPAGRAVVGGRRARQLQWRWLVTARTRSYVAALAALSAVVCAVLLIAPPKGHHLLSGALAAAGLALGAVAIGLYVFGRPR